VTDLITKRGLTS